MYKGTIYARHTDNGDPSWGTAYADAGVINVMQWRNYMCPKTTPTAANVKRLALVWNVYGFNSQAMSEGVAYYTQWGGKSGWSENHTSLPATYTQPFQGHRLCG